MLEDSISQRTKNNRVKQFGRTRPGMGASGVLMKEGGKETFSMENSVQTDRRDGI